ncbi:endonuclease VII domain-containing protein [uncultured Halomonas sp.]|uniref:endonuclease VII domain-containing protein n=1 Tax=uncultured Halomonas sp. TaxID=173971 RepID=UPI0034599532
MQLRSCERHPERKSHSRGMCRSCYDAWLRERNPGYRKRQTEVSRKWARENPEKVKQARDRWRLDKENRRALQERRRLKEYGISPEEYRRRYDAQSGSCGICGEHQENLCVDHCHDSGAVRGLLCKQCNSAIGFLGDTEEGVNRALRYLRSAREIQDLGE